LVSGLMQGGPAPSGVASAQTAIQNAAQRPQPKPMGQQVADVLGGVALPLSAAPFIGDIAGLGADAAMYANYPEERTALNYGLTLAGMLPFVPSAAGIRSAQGAAEGALDMSQAARRANLEKFMEGSEVRDYTTGNPFMVYHGTTSPKDFDVFDTVSTAGQGQNDQSLSGLGTWFAGGYFNDYGDKFLPDSGRAVANYFAGEQLGFPEGARVIPAYLSIKNPKPFEYYEDLYSAVQRAGGVENYRNNLIKKGYDGILIDSSDTDVPAIRQDWVAFYPRQIKSAIGNLGTFDSTNPNMMAGAAGAAVGLSALRQLIPQQEQE
jgi:hypothetical protein